MQKVHFFMSNSKEPKVLVGGIIGEPQCGKSSFLNIVARGVEATPPREKPTSTPYFEVYRFKNFMIDKNSRSFKLLDARGHFFDVLLDRDREMLKLFIDGLSAGSQLDQNALVNTDNAVSHVILCVNARSIFNPNWLKIPVYAEKKQAEKKEEEKNAPEFDGLFHFPGTPT